MEKLSQLSQGEVEVGGEYTQTYLGRPVGVVGKPETFRVTVESEGRVYWTARLHDGSIAKFRKDGEGFFGLSGQTIN